MTWVLTVKKREPEVPWIYMVAGGIVAGIAGLGAAIAYEERKREWMMLFRRRE